MAEAAQQLPTPDEDASHREQAPAGPEALSSDEVARETMHRLVEAAEQKKVGLADARMQLRVLLKTRGATMLSVEEDDLASLAQKADAYLKELQDAAQMVKEHDAGRAEPTMVEVPLVTFAPDEERESERLAKVEPMGVPVDAEETVTPRAAAEGARSPEALRQGIERVVASIDEVPAEAIDQIVAETGLDRATVAGIISGQREAILHRVRDEVRRSAGTKRTFMESMAKAGVMAGAGIGLAAFFPPSALFVAAALGVTRLVDAFLGGKRYEREVEQRLRERLTDTGEQGKRDRDDAVENFEAELAVAVQRKATGAVPLAEIATPEDAVGATRAYVAERAPELTSEQREKMARVAGWSAETDREQDEHGTEIIRKQPALEKVRALVGKAYEGGAVVLRGGPTAKERLLTAGVFTVAGAIARESTVVRTVLLAYSGARIGELVAGLLTKKRSERTQRFARRVGRVVGGAIGAGLGFLGASAGRSAHAEHAPAPSEPASGVPVEAAGASGEPVTIEGWLEQNDVTPAQYAAAEFKPTEGFTHPVVAQLVHEPQHFGFTGNVEDARAVDAWAVDLAKRAAIAEGFLKADGITTTHGIHLPDGETLHIVARPDGQGGITVDYIGEDGRPMDIEALKFAHRHIAGEAAQLEAAQAEVAAIPALEQLVNGDFRDLQIRLDAFRDPIHPAWPTSEDFERYREAFNHLMDLKQRAEEIMIPTDFARYHEQHIAGPRAWLGEAKEWFMAAAPGAGDTAPEAVAPDATEPLPEQPPPAVEPPPAAPMEPVPAVEPAPPPAPPPAPEVPPAPAVAEATPADTAATFTTDAIPPETSASAVQSFLDAKDFPAKVNAMKGILAPNHQAQLRDNLWVRRSSGPGNFIFLSLDGKNFQPMTRFNVIVAESHFRRGLLSS